MGFLSMPLGKYSNAPVFVEIGLATRITGTRSRSAYLPEKKREGKTERSFARQLAEGSRFSGFSEPGDRF
jgi:hypothetical protein